MGALEFIKKLNYELYSDGSLCLYCGDKEILNADLISFPINQKGYSFNIHILQHFPNKTMEQIIMELKPLLTLENIESDPIKLRLLTRKRKWYLIKHYWYIKYLDVRLGITGYYGIDGCNRGIIPIIKRFFSSRFNFKLK